MCRDMNYPWAEGVSYADDTPTVSTDDLTKGVEFPDYCPAAEDGVATECPPFDALDATSRFTSVNCRRKFSQ